MNEALGYLFDILQGFANFVFTDAMLFSGVSLGLVTVCIWLMGIIIRNVVNLPSKSSTFNIHTRNRGDD